MGWLVVIVLAPVLFAIVAAYVIVRVALLVLRVAFAPLALRRR